MIKPIVFMFSGQGSAYYQMGKKLYNTNQVFKRHMDRLDSIIFKRNNISVIKELYNDNNSKDKYFGNILYTNPAIIMIEYALSQVLIENGIEPSCLIGSSLGNFTSFALANAIKLEDVLDLSIKMADLFFHEAPKGGMITIMDSVNVYYDEYLINTNSELISLNYDSHFVISGLDNNLDIITNFLKKKNILFQRLPISYPFHSSIIDSLEMKFKKMLENFSPLKIEMPLYSCIDTERVKIVDSDFLWKIIRKPILFKDVINTLENIGPHIYIDLGPSSTLANFTIKNLKSLSKSKIYPIINPFDRKGENLKTIFNEIKVKEKNKEPAVTGDKRAYVFPGQGVQRKGFGGELLDRFPEIVKKADDILGYSLKELCLGNLSDKLSRTQYSQPAIYVVNALHYLNEIKQNNSKPDYLAGHSLGEYSALFVSKAFNFEEGLRIVKKRGELMGEALNGGMAAIIGLNEVKVSKILKDNNLLSISIANYNSPEQIVISGPKDDIVNAQSIFENAGSRHYIILNVSGAFHSKYMSEAGKKFESFLENFTFSPPTIPVISNVHARPYTKGNVKELLVKQITSPVKWTESIRFLMGQSKKMEFIEIGYGNVLTNIISKIKDTCSPIIIEKGDKTEEMIKNDNEPHIPHPKNTAYEEQENINEKETGVYNNMEYNKRKLDNTNRAVIKNKIQKGNDKKRNNSFNMLGDSDFQKDYNCKFSYVAGGMHLGISSPELVIKMGKATILSFYGTKGLKYEDIKNSLEKIKGSLCNDEPYGVNCVYHPFYQENNEKIIDLLLEYGVRNIEVSGMIDIPLSLIRYKAAGIQLDNNGEIICKNKIMIKVSRAEIAELFLRPVDPSILEKMILNNQITKEKADLLKRVPIANDICVEVYSSLVSEKGNSFALLPFFQNLRNRIKKEEGHKKKVRVGFSGGIGTPQSAAAAFILGADFITTGSINQCTVEAQTSDIVKDMLQQANIHDFDYAPDYNMFEIGGKEQVFKKGVLFSARANKLYNLYSTYKSLDELDDKIRIQLQDKFFKKNIDEVYNIIKSEYSSHEIEEMEKDSKYKIAGIFKWYLKNGLSLAINGKEDQKVNFKIKSSEAMGALNSWTKGSYLENWRNRNVDKIAEKIMQGAAKIIDRQK